MAIDKIQAESINLADNYAFTGTVTGASDVVLISTQTTGSASAINFTSLDNTYNHYQIFFQDLQFASNNQTFILRISDDNGNSFKSSGYLSILHQGYYNGSNVDKSVNASVNHHLISTDVTNASDNRSTFGYVYFRTPATARKHTFVGHNATLNANGYILDNKTSTVYNTNQTFNAVSFLGSSNFAGTFKLYGYN